jgi:L-ascorbate metabolism protein UlaG (beta-lactamase superfamily)
MLYNNIQIDWLGHSSIKIKTKDKIIYIDPYNILNEQEKADYILITHIIMTIVPWQTFLD